jgi:hypothetical protein
MFSPISTRVTGVFITIVLAGMTAAAAAPFSIAINGRNVIASNAQDNANVVFVGDHIETYRGFPLYFHSAVVLPATGSQATLTLPRDVPPLAVWFAVDETTGDLAVNIPPGSLARELVLDPATLKKDSEGNISRIRFPFLVADMVLVRPGEGAWRASVIDGGPRDGDGAEDGGATVVLDALALMEQGKKPPHAVKKGDVIIAISPKTLTYCVIRVKQ